MERMTSKLLLLLLLLLFATLMDFNGTVVVVQSLSIFSLGFFFRFVFERLAVVMARLSDAMGV